METIRPPTTTCSCRRSRPRNRVLPGHRLREQLSATVTAIAVLAFTVGWPPLAEADITRMMTGGLTYPTATLDKSQASLSVRLHYIDTPDRSRPSAGNMRAIGCYLRAHDSGRAGCNSSPIPRSKVNATRRLVEARLYATWPAAVQQSYEQASDARVARLLRVVHPRRASPASSPCSAASISLPFSNARQVR